MSHEVGLVLVHGIGSQIQGATAKDFIEAAAGTTPPLLTAEGPSGGFSVAGRTVRVYEAYWADLLQGEVVRGSFDLFDIQAVAWFPWLNLRSRMIRKGRIRAALWTLVAAPLALLIQLGLAVAMYTWSRLRRALDERVADVLNYVDSADGATSEDSPLRPVSRQIEDRVRACITTAVRDGCSEVQVIAHSLGSVIAYRVLVGADDASPPWSALGRVTRLYTIGSPIERFHGMWPLLLRPAGNTPAGPIHWENFSDPLDLIAQRVRHSAPFGEAHGHTIFGRSGFLTAHGAYQRHPNFVSALALGISGEQLKVEVTLHDRLTRFALSLAETLLGVLIVLMLLAVGVVTTVIVVALIAFVLGILAVVGSILEDAGSWSSSGLKFWDAVQYVAAAFVFLALIVLPLTLGRVKARIRHYHHHYGQAPDLSHLFDDEQRDPPSKAVERGVAGVLIIVGLGLGTLFLYGTPSLPMPWWPDVTLLGRIGVTALLLVYAAGSSLILGLLFRGVHGAWRFWLRWHRATTRPPASPGGGTVRPVAAAPQSEPPGATGEQRA